MMLSKSKYLIGLQCPKYLWRMYHEPEKIPEPTPSQKFRFEQGHLVEEYAWKLFPDGINIEIENISKNLEETKKLLEKRKPLFELIKYRNKPR